MFHIKIAGHTAQVHPLFASTRDYCARYLTEEAPELTITVTRSKAGVGEYGRYIRRERFHGTLCRSFDISAVDTELVTAQYDNGVLTIQLPKKECARTSVRSVTVE